MLEAAAVMMRETQLTVPQKGPEAPGRLRTHAGQLNDGGAAELFEAHRTDDPKHFEEERRGVTARSAAKHHL
jgi:hypothetical protein